MQYPVTVLGATIEAINLADALGAWRRSKGARRQRKAYGGGHPLDAYPERDAREDHLGELSEYLDDALAASRGVP